MTLTKNKYAEIQNEFNNHDAVGEMAYLSELGFKGDEIAGLTNYTINDTVNFTETEAMLSTLLLLQTNKN